MTQWRGVEARSIMRPEVPTMDSTNSHREYWSRNLRITAILMAIWFSVTFVPVYFARELSFAFFGWPFSVWVAGQGALIVYCLIVWYYQRTMNKLDIAHNVHEDQ
jgi:putative solute:sodium symporter small subunit